MFDTLIYFLLIFILYKEYKRIKKNDIYNKQQDDDFLQEIKKQTNILIEIENNTNILK